MPPGSRRRRASCSAPDPPDHQDHPRQREEPVANEQLEQAKLEVIEYANRMLTEGLVKGTSGNVSARVGDQVAITPGSVPYAEITPDRVAIVDLDGNHISGGTPSSETPLHTLVYRETDAAAV